MRLGHALTIGSFAVVLILVVWQARTIRDLREDVTSLRRDLKAALHHSVAGSPASTPADLTTPPSREELELIRLRHQVRELNESLVISRGRERSAKIGNVLSSVIPVQPPSGPWNIRPEWKGMESLITNHYAKAIQNLDGTTNEFTRFLSLGRAATTSLAVGRNQDARQFAEDMLVLDEKHSRGAPEKSNGQVIHDAHLVLGVLALDEGQLEDAKRHLLASGKNNGSPSLSTFGPSMILAKGLLEKGEQAVVLQYLEQCRSFWTMGEKDLEAWTKDIHAGRIPEFGSRRLY